MMKSNITPFLWFNDDAEQAIKFYKTVFKDTKILYINRQGKKLFSASISINGQKFNLLNGGPHYKLTPGFSFFIDCKTQKEVDTYWKKLSKGGTPMQCGWVTDRFGVTWQVIPDQLGKYLADKDPQKAGRVMDAMMKMVKLDVKLLKNAYEGK